MEVSSSTLAIDLGRELGLYPAAGIPEYWVVDIKAQRALLHTQPGSNGYSVVREVAFGETPVSAAIEGLQV